MEALLEIAHWFGSAVCDQLPTHSYHIGDVVLPLCARCTGLYLGALLTLLYLVVRRRSAGGWPSVQVSSAFILFFLAWAGDGVNSFLSIIPAAPHAYPPDNLLRLVTGTLMGIGLGTFIFATFNAFAIPHSQGIPVFSKLSELVAPLGGGALLIFLVQSEWPPLLYPLALLSLIAILTLHAVLMGALIAATRARCATVRPVRSQLLAAGLAIALVYLDVIALGRVALGEALGRPI